MAKVNQPSNLLDRLRRIEQDVRQLRSRLGLSSATFRGEFTILHAVAGTWLFKVGRGAQGKYFLSIRRDDGTVVFEIGTTDAGHQFGAWWDRSSNVIISDDATSGQGLARPWLPQPSVTILGSAIPMASNTTWITTQSSGYVLKQQPWAELQALVRADGGSAGQARFTVNGVQVGDVMGIGVDEFTWKPLQRVELPGTYNDYIRTELQVQRTSGTGSVGGVFVWVQRQT